MIKIKNVYTRASTEDGKRILVERFWPEGLKTQEALVDEWLRELAPSYDLQRFHFNISNWDSYKSMYIEELLSENQNKDKLKELADFSNHGTLTLLYGNKDSEHNHANILKEVIDTEIRTKYGS